MTSGPWLRETVALGRVAGPLVVTQLVQVGMGFTDTLFAGRLGATALGAVGLGFALWIPALLAMLGILTALSPIVAQLDGAGRTAAIAARVRQALWLALVVGALASIAVVVSPALLGPLGIDASLHSPTRDYLDALAWGLPGAALFAALRFTSEGLGRTAPIMLVSLVALAANALLDYVLMFGAFGVPALGVAGAGHATAIVMWMELALLGWYVRRAPALRALGIFARFDPPRRRALAEHLALGAPIAGAMLLEVGFFTGIALLMGRWGAAGAGAHQVAVNWAALMFMVPLGIGLAATVRVGQSIGRRDTAGARRAASVALLIGLGFALVSASAMLLIPEAITAAYGAEAGVAALAVDLLRIAALFQLADALQVVAMGALRGLKDTRVPMWISAIAYWAIGLPLGWWLGVVVYDEPRMLWWGFVAGLVTAAVLLLARLHTSLRPAALEARFVTPDDLD
ncbi:MAG: MATE family efflux transporter [Chromatiales bacterium]|nr:MATE family efflux transporter [Chromatiales bacterium]